MRAIGGRWPSVLATGALALGLAGLIGTAQEPPTRKSAGGTGEGVPGKTPEKAQPGSQDPEWFDRQVYEVLKTVINTGADLYNRDADRAGCYRLYQGSLLTLRPLLVHHPDLQKRIDDALAEAERRVSTGARAHALRPVFDEIRARLRPAAVRQPTGQPAPESQAPEPLPRAPEVTGKAPAPESLWQRLGGEPAIRQVVEDWVAKAGTDPKVNFDRNGKYKLTDQQVGELKEKMVAFISQLTGGPLKYQGKDMREVHQGMGITEAEFDAALADLRKVLVGHGIKPAEEQDLLKLLRSTQKDIVAVKPGSERKNGPVEKIQPQKKTEGTKSE